MTTEQKYVHYHVQRHKDRIDGAVDMQVDLSKVYTLENATRETAYQNIMDADSTYWATFCHDEDCDKTRRPA